MVEAPPPLGNSLDAARALESAIDALIDSALSVQKTTLAVVDWAWFRFSTLRVLVRDEASLVTAASIARGLLEEAAHWDWRASSGADVHWISSQAADEFQRLRQRAEELEDEVWIDWLIPPDSGFSGPGDNGPPETVSDAVARMGHGFPSHWYASLPVSAISAVYRLLSTCSHGNLTAVGALRSSEGWDGDPELPALVLHVAGASCALIALGAVDPGGEAEAAVVAAAGRLRQEAELVHGVASQATPATGRPSRSTTREPFAAESVISRMPDAPAEVIEAGRVYSVGAARLMRRHAGDVRETDAISQQAFWCLRFAAEQLDSFTAIMNEKMGRALLPYVARPTMELAAAWAWVTAGAPTGEFRDRLRTLLGHASGLVDIVEREFEKRGVGARAPSFLGGAHIAAVARAAGALPDARMPSEYLAVGYADWGGVTWAAPIYGVLSQFVHVTPIALLHLQRDRWASLSAPAFSVAVDAFVTGFTVLVQRTLPLAGVSGVDFTALVEATQTVRFATSKYHFIG